MLSLAAVIVLFNPDYKVARNIKKLLPFVDKIYLIDNSNSLVFSNSYEKSEKIEYIPNRKNMGVAAALNKGAFKAKKDGFKWLLTMDQDSTFYDKSLDKMKQQIENINDDKTAIFSPVHILKCMEDREPLVVMTSGNIINLNIYDKIGGFDNNLFIDCVDFDYCLKARTLGYKIVRFNNIRLKHNLGKIEEKTFFGKKVIVTNHEAERRFFITRNRHYIYKKYSKSFKKFCKNELKNTRHENIKILLFEKQKCKKLFLSFKGWLAYLTGK